MQARGGAWGFTLEINPLIFKAHSEQRVPLDQEEFFARIIANQIDEHRSGPVVPTENRIAASLGILVLLPRHSGVFGRRFSCPCLSVLLSVSRQRSFLVSHFFQNKEVLRRVGVLRR